MGTECSHSVNTIRGFFLSYSVGIFPTSSSFAILFLLQSTGSRPGYQSLQEESEMIDYLDKITGDMNDYSGDLNGTVVCKYIMYLLSHDLPNMEVQLIVTSVRHRSGLGTSITTNQHV